MELTNITCEEARGFDQAKSRETELEIRRELTQLRVDVYSNPAATTSTKKKLRKSLARLMTVRSEQALKSKKNG